MLSQIRTGVEFEQFIINGLVEAGLRVMDTPASNDYGADLVFEYRGCRFVGQCKFYSKAVGLKAVQEVLGALSVYNAHCGVVFTNSSFTQQAQNLAAANRVLLIDGFGLGQFEYNQYGIPIFDQFLNQQNAVHTVSEEERDWVMNDLIVRYGKSAEKIRKDFMGLGMPYYKIGREYHFDPKEVKRWEIEQRAVPVGHNGVYYLPEYTAYGHRLLKKLKAAKGRGDRDEVKRLRKLRIKYGYAKPRWKIALSILVWTIVIVAMIGSLTYLVNTNIV